MAWNATLPVASTVLSSAELRANWAAIQASLGGGVNWVADPGHYIWPAETANGADSQTVPPAHWQLSGTGATVRRCGPGLTDTNHYGSGGWATELSFGSATAFLFQDLLDDTIPTILNGESISLGAAVKCGTGSAARIFVQDSTGIQYSDYHSGGGAFEWLTLVGELAASSGGVQVGLELSSASAHVQGMTGLLGDIVPLFPLPAPVVYGSYGISFPGVPGSGVFTPFRITPGRPFLFCGLAVSVGTLPSGDTLVVNLRRSTGSFVDMLAANMTLSDGHRNVSNATVDTVYRYRCIDQFYGASTASNTDNVFLGYVVTNAGNAGDLIFAVRGLQFARPQDALTLFNDPTKDGS